MSEGSGGQPQQNNNQDFQNKAIGAAPKFAMSLAGLIIALALSFRLADIEISDGINRYIAAKAKAVELEVENRNYGKGSEGSEDSTAITELKGDVEHLKVMIEGLDKDIDKLYSVAHTYRGGGAVKR